MKIKKKQVEKFLSDSNTSESSEAGRGNYLTAALYTYISSPMLFCASAR